MQLELKPSNQRHRNQFSLTIVQEVQEVGIRMGRLVHSLRLLIDRVERGQTKVIELIEIEELGVGEQSEVGIEVVRSLLLLLLLQSLVIRRWNRVQVLDILRKVGRATPVVASHVVGSVENEL
jgi:hypothetical protein